MPGATTFISVPISNATSNWNTNSYTQIDEGATSGQGDGSAIAANEDDSGETQSYNHDKPPSGLLDIDQIKWYVRTGIIDVPVTGNVFVNGAWQASQSFSVANTNYTQTLSGSFTDFSTFQVRFISGTMDKNDDSQIHFSTLELFGTASTNLQGGDFRGGNYGTG